ncbi:MAG: GNAT family N-acetyltransferase [Armatimonadetes bacterium]|jgi:GNAT superfamily N-acetyltransferase|nr:GNAT family N-acetyltransferase [Armatimonadota bacterium]
MTPDNEWSVGPIKPEETSWFREIAPESACEPYEIEAALAEDEILVWRSGGVPAAAASLIWRAFEMELRILVVDRSFRRQGLASRILLELRDLAKQRGLRRIVLFTSNDNTPAIRLYQKIGFRLKALYPGRLERKRGCVRLGVDDIPIRDDVEMVWEF